jgi:hypothetical protein
VLKQESGVIHMNHKKPLSVLGRHRQPTQGITTRPVSTSVDTARIDALRTAAMLARKQRRFLRFIEGDLLSLGS